MIDFTDYEKVLVGATEKLAVLCQLREETQIEIAKLRNFIHATVTMLPDSEQLKFQKILSDLAAESGGLTVAVREALKLAAQDGIYMTAAQVRDHLVQSGFDFSQYSSNPLASVNTTIRRFKSSVVQSTTIDGVMAYRWISRFPRLIDAVRNEAPDLSDPDHPLVKSGMQQQRKKRTPETA